MQNARLIRGCGWRLAFKLSCKYLYLVLPLPHFGARKVEQEVKNLDRLTEIEACATVGDQGGFTDAARKMGISKSTV